MTFGTREFRETGNVERSRLGLPLLGEEKKALLTQDHFSSVGNALSSIVLAVEEWVAQGKRHNTVLACWSVILMYGLNWSRYANYRKSFDLL